MTDQPPASPFLKVKSCGICRSDRKAFESPPSSMTLPRVLGHEICGELIRSLPGRQRTGGDRVTLWPALACGRCSFCLSGRQNLCPAIELFGYHLDGGFADYLSLPEDRLGQVVCLDIPACLNCLQATFAEPAGCIINGLGKHAGPQPEILLILGGGVMGRLAARIGRLLWPGTRIFIHEPDPVRRELAAGDGMVDPCPAADLVLVATSNPVAFQEGLASLGPGGALLLFSGLPRGRETVSIHHNHIHRREQTIVGAYGCRPGDMAEALALLAGGGLVVDDLITRIISPEEVARELATSAGPESFKTIISQ